MNAIALLSFGAAWLIGVLLVLALRPAETMRGRDGALVLTLGAALGLGVTSVIFFGVSCYSTHPAAVDAATEALLSIALGWYVVRRRAPASAVVTSAVRFSTLDWLLATVFVQAAVVASIVAWRAYRMEPYGGWDGWAIWNLHARFMLRAGPEWRHVLLAPQLSWSHPDYPWLVPASVARIWAWSGAESAGASAFVSAAFGVSTVGLLAAIVGRLRGVTAASLAALLLLGTPFFVTFSTNQHADIPLAAYLLACVGSLLWQRLLLAGLCAGLAAWTKNEGVLFAAVATVLVLTDRGRRGEWQRFFAGLGIAAIPVLVFKLAFAPPNDLFATPVTTRLAQLVDPARHAAILSAFWRDVQQFGEWQWLPYVALALPLVAWRHRGRFAAAVRPTGLAVGAMLGGYYIVYVLSPQNLQWHLDTSLVRLLLQLWPLVLLGWALVVPLPQFGAAPSTAPRFTRIVFWATNPLVALLLGALLRGDLAADELALGRAAGATVSVALGDGWYGVERDRGQRWSWSRGEATLRLDPEHSLRTQATMRIRFALRSLQPRTVTIVQDEHVLWRGAVGENYVRVELANVTIPAMGAVLHFSTDAPATAEAASNGARQLAFALYNLKID